MIVERRQIPSKFIFSIRNMALHFSLICFIRCHISESDSAYPDFYSENKCLLKRKSEVIYQGVHIWISEIKKNETCEIKLDFLGG